MISPADEVRKMAYSSLMRQIEQPMINAFASGQDFAYRIRETFAERGSPHMPLIVNFACDFMPMPAGSMEDALPAGPWHVKRFADFAMLCAFMPDLRMFDPFR